MELRGLPPAFRALARPRFALAALCLAGMIDDAVAGLSGLQRVASGQNQVTAMEFAPGDADRLFIGQRSGAIRVFNLVTNAFEPAPLIVIDGLDTEVEGGLLGLAFHPDFQNNGKFYVNVSVDNGGIPLDDVNVSPFSMHIREYTASRNPYVANASFVNVLDFVKPQAWHNGGWLEFGPDDGYLHILTGDGGAAFDVGPGHTPGTGNARDLSDNLLGKLLRIDVDGDDFPLDPQRNYAIPPENPFVGQEGDDEILAYGLRSPWQASFDRATGDLWIGDVGETTREEIDVLPAGTGGQNFGWNKREGAIATPSTVGGELPGSVDPVYDYAHTGQPGEPSLQGNSVTGGFVYRGPDPELQGKNLFADFQARKFFLFDPADPYATVENVTAELPASAGTAGFYTVFAEDPVGNLYVGTVAGDVFRIVTDATMPGDFNRDAAVDGDDLAAWSSAYGVTNAADADGDGDADGGDFLLWQHNLGTSALNPISASSSGQTVPEPTSKFLAAIAALAWARGGATHSRR